jgi:decaprenyl-phosphate phosphoribosyltransferase
VTASALGAGGLVLAWALSLSLVFVLGTYFLLQVAYNLALKHLLILDIMALAAGFVLRAVAGGFAARVQLSPWFLFCVALLALYVGLQKRKSELVRMSKTGVATRTVLTEYSTSYLERVETALLACTLIAYALWSIQGASTPWMMLSVPFVLYGLLRYQYLSGQEIVERPEEVIFQDRPLLINLVCWGLTCFAILAFHHR